MPSNENPVVLVAVENSWHGLMRLPKIIAKAGADMVLLCRPGELLACSRYARRVIEVRGSPEAFCRALLGHLRTYGDRYAMCIAPDEGLLCALQAFDDPLLASLLPFTQDPAAIDCLHSKLGFLQACSAMGVPVAQYRFCHTRVEVALGLEAISFPVVLKAVASSGGSGVRIVRDQTELSEAVRQLGFPLALQAYVVGQPFSTEVLFDRGVPVSWSSSAQLNRWPHTLGSITAKQMIEVPGIESALRALGHWTKFHGFACIDAMKPDDGGQIVFCEMNPMQGVEATADKRVLAVFACALGRMLRNEPPLIRAPLPIDRRPVGLFPETFFYAKSHARELSSWVVALRSLRHLPYDDPPLLLSLSVNLFSSLLPGIGLGSRITRILRKKRAASIIEVP